MFAIFEKYHGTFVPSKMGGVPQAIFEKYHGTFYQQNDESCIQIKVYCPKTNETQE